MLRLKAGRSVDAARQQIAEEIESIVNDLQTRRELVNSRREATRLAHALLRDEEARYQHGQSTRTDLIRAQTAVAERELEEIQAIVEFNVDMARFHRLKGTYLEHNNIEIEAVPGN